jgi:hypothetical protein
MPASTQSQRDGGDLGYIESSFEYDLLERGRLAAKRAQWKRRWRRLVVPDRRRVSIR